MPAPALPKAGALFPPHQDRVVAKPKQRTKGGDSKKQKNGDQGLEPAQVAKHSSDAAAPSSAPPAELLQLIQGFLSSYGLDKTSEAFSAERKAKRKAHNWEKDTPEKRAGQKLTLVNVYKQWRADPAGHSTGSESEEQDDSSSSGSESSGSKSSAASEQAGRKTGPKQANGNAADASSSSDPSSDSDADDEDDAAAAPAVAVVTKPAANGKAKKLKRKSSPDSSESESASSSQSGSGSSSDESTAKKPKTTKGQGVKITKVSVTTKVNEASSDSSADSSSEDSSESEDAAPLKKKADASAAKTVVQKRKRSASPKGSPAAAEAAKKFKKNNTPFQRVPTDTVVDPKLSSNAYQSYDYADRAFQDLSVTRGKGFTKEKNKKKRGSYRGGWIDVNGGKSVKFDD